jgi:hypothetical protein
MGYDIGEEETMIDTRAVLAAAAIAFGLGVLLGTVGERGTYKRNTYECTIACPQNAQSLKHEGSCYCKNSER